MQPTFEDTNSLIEALELFSHEVKDQDLALLMTEAADRLSLLQGAYFGRLRTALTLLHALLDDEDVDWDAIDAQVEALEASMD